MHDGLVKRLRDKETAHLPGGYRLCGEAADALERIEADFRDYIGKQVHKTSGVYACCYCKNRNTPEIWAIGCQRKDCDGVNEWKWGGKDG